MTATKAFSHRVPEELGAEGKQLADEAFSTYLDVMRGNVKRGALFRLMAAKHVREELCPPIPKTLQHTGASGGPVQVSINLQRAPARIPAETLASSSTPTEE